MKKIKMSEGKDRLDSIASFYNSMCCHVTLSKPTDPNPSDVLWTVYVMSKFSSGMKIYVKQRMKGR